MRPEALSAINGAMQDQRPRFNLRLTPELDTLVNRSSRTTGRSKNAVILDALDWRLNAEHPDRDLVDALRPLLENLTDDQRAALVAIVAAMAKGPAQRDRS